MFEKWFALIDSDIGRMEQWQWHRYKKNMKKAYEAGRKKGKEEALHNAALSGAGTVQPGDGGKK